MPKEDREQVHVVAPVPIAEEHMEPEERAEEHLEEIGRLMKQALKRYSETSEEELRARHSRLKWPMV